MTGRGKTTYPFLGDLCDAYTVLHVAAESSRCGGTGFLFHLNLHLNSPRGPQVASGSRVGQCGSAVFTFWWFSNFLGGDAAYCRVYIAAFISKCI